MGIKLTIHEVRIVGIFERLTGVHVKDCIVDEGSAYFLVQPGMAGFVIGKNGSKIKNVAKAIGRKVRVFEYADTPEEMIKNFIPSARSITINDGVATVAIPNSERSSIIGRNGRNIKMIKEFLRRHFNINNLRLK